MKKDQTLVTPLPITCSEVKHKTNWGTLTSQCMWAVKWKSMQYFLRIASESLGKGIHFFLFYNQTTIHKATQFQVPHGLSLSTISQIVMLNSYKQTVCLHMYNKQCSAATAAAAAAAAEWLDTTSFAKDHCGCHCWILIWGDKARCYSSPFWVRPDVDNTSASANWEWLQSNTMNKKR